MKKAILKTIITLLITIGLLKLTGLDKIFLNNKNWNFFSEETARNLDTVNEPYNGWNEEEFQKYLEENFTQDENGLYIPR